MIFLQAKIVETSTSVLLNYGVAGAMLILCILALVYVHKSSTKQFEGLRIMYKSKFVDLWHKWVVSLGEGEVAPNFLKKDRFIAGL